ncbi:hypothetical protein BFW01_g6625 [Lasiodiplodia theobromae]|uniref:Uncharacterized protein n=1 Tax=Lasiodiplodia theobromae TaxID=45133 RepID=A0A5N5DSA1_9PEZI|nr:uncharacterized protein LTHEOB_6889 [Lasiodiplodia theobromae]KAB2580866.1 hypothetical protein DBV05_g716 [Lasiodiplodia theobromae]KAF4543155.1 hypothetical protein LTHEOB_6889 [Lasiodiplodia theobromae]KAF9635730.1 hypothetical protein BFW01_g6625 [Lasiodiplodia theobromae]
MKFSVAAIMLAAATSVVALPAPASEAEIDALRAQGISEHDIAARFPRSGHTTASIIVRRHIDVDGEVAPGHYASPVGSRDIEAHAGLDENSAEGHAVAKHVNAVKAFISDVLSGRIATAGNGGVAMRLKRSSGTMGQQEGEMQQQRPARWTYHW